MSRSTTASDFLLTRAEGCLLFVGLLRYWLIHSMHECIAYLYNEYCCIHYATASCHNRRAGHVYSYVSLYVSPGLRTPVNVRIQFLLHSCLASQLLLY